MSNRYVYLNDGPGRINGEVSSQGKINHNTSKEFRNYQVLGLLFLDQFRGIPFPSGINLMDSELTHSLVFFLVKNSPLNSCPR